MRSIIETGGIVVWLQFALAFWGLILVLERLLFFQGAKVHTTNLLIGLGNHLRRRAYAEAAHEVGRVPGPVMRVVRALVMRPGLERADLRMVAEEAVCLEIPRVERNLRGLLSVALLTPILGILGTVLGLMEAFMDVEESGGMMSSAAMSKGIFQSLITTALGISIATAAYIFYLALLGKARRLVFKMQRVGIETVNLICDAREEGEIVSFQEEQSARAKQLTKKEELEVQKEGK